MALTVRLTKKLRDFTLAAEFTLNGGALGLMGGSGSGKSMLLKCIAGVETPDSGYIALNGRVLFDSAKKINLPPQRRKVGYLFQNYALFPNMSVEENILCGLRAKGLPQAECRARVAAMTARFRLEGLEKSYPRQLSGGQKQRVAIARLLVTEPEAMFLDEPFSALDADLKDELQGELQALLGEYGGVSIIVSHDRREIERLADDVFYIHQGRLQKGNVR